MRIPISFEPLLREIESSTDPAYIHKSCENLIKSFKNAEELPDAFRAVQLVKNNKEFQATLLVRIKTKSYTYGFKKELLDYIEDKLTGEFKGFCKYMIGEQQKK